jgi:hypothetical protein
MAKIHNDTSAYANYKLPIDCIVNIVQLSEHITQFHVENAHSEAVSSAKSNGSARISDAQRCNRPHHPSILSPFNIIKEDGIWYFLYKVEANGMTLRNWITSSSVIKIHNLDILLSLIDTYEFMLSNNISFCQSNINPDRIWVEYDASNNIHVRVLNTHETMAYGCDSCNRNYWSPELIGKYNHVNYYDHDSNSDQQKSLKRYNTRPSTLSSVYSLGLILYFLTYKDDPFTDIRNPYDRPTELTNGNIRISSLIRNATTPDIKERPTMQDWKTQIIDSRKKTNVVCEFLQSIFLNMLKGIFIIK